MRFAEMVPGRVVRGGPRRVEADEIIAFAREWDPQPFHIDEAAARATAYGGLIASGWHTCVIAMRMLADGVLAGSESTGSPGLNGIKWLLPVRPGDTLSITFEVLEQRRSKSNPSRGIVRARWQVINQRDEVTTEIESVNLFDLDPAES